MAKKFNFADAANTPIAQSATDTMAKAFEQPAPTQHPSPNNQHPTPNTQQPSSITQHPSPTINTPIEHLAQRRLQVQNEYASSPIQQLSLKTFPEAGNWKLEEVVRMFNLKKTPGTPKMTKAALSEILLLDAVNDIYDKVCSR